MRITTSDSNFEFQRVLTFNLQRPTNTVRLKASDLQSPSRVKCVNPKNQNLNPKSIRAMRSAPISRPLCRLRKWFAFSRAENKRSNQNKPNSIFSLWITASEYQLNFSWTSWYESQSMNLYVFNVWTSEANPNGIIKGIFLPFLVPLFLLFFCWQLNDQNPQGVRAERSAGSVPGLYDSLIWLAHMTRSATRLWSLLLPVLSTPQAKCGAEERTLPVRGSASCSFSATVSLRVSPTVSPTVSSTFSPMSPHSDSAYVTPSRLAGARKLYNSGEL